MADFWKKFSSSISPGGPGGGNMVLNLMMLFKTAFHLVAKAQYSIDTKIVLAVLEYYIVACCVYIEL